MPSRTMLTVPFTYTVSGRMPRKRNRVEAHVRDTEHFTIGVLAPGEAPVALVWRRPRHPDLDILWHDDAFWQAVRVQPGRKDPERVVDLASVEHEFATRLGSSLLPLPQTTGCWRSSEAKTLDEYEFADWTGGNREARVGAIQAALDGYRVLDGVLLERVREPVYRVQGTGEASYVRLDGWAGDDQEDGRRVYRLDDMDGLIAELGTSAAECFLHGSYDVLMPETLRADPAIASLRRELEWVLTRLRGDVAEMAPEQMLLFAAVRDAVRSGDFATAADLGPELAGLTSSEYLREHVRADVEAAVERFRASRQGRSAPVDEPLPTLQFF